MKNFTRNFTFLFVSLLLCIGMQIKANNLTVADGTVTSQYLPIEGFNIDRVGTIGQCLYPSDYLSEMINGQISQMTFYLSTTTASWESAVFNVSIGETNQTSLSSSFYSGELTPVYTGALDPTQPMMSIVFSSPYVYEGGNLLVQIEVTTKGSYKKTLFYGVNLSGAGRNRSGASGTGTSQDFLPKVTFEYMPEEGDPNCTKPSEVSVSNITAQGATLAWVGGSNTYDVEYKKASDTNWTSVLLNTNLTTTTITGLAPYTNYQVRVRSVCPNLTSESAWKAASFKTLFNLPAIIVNDSASVESVTLINDKVYPWFFNGEYLCSTNKAVNQSKSEFAFSYTSSYQTYVQFEWINYYTSNHILQCYVDGIYKYANTSTTPAANQFFLPAGTHVITFRDSVYSTSSNYDRTSGIRNIRIREIHPFESVVLADNSLPLTFTNEVEYPWVIESDGSICSGNYGYKNSTSSFYTTFTITEPSMLSFDYISKHLTDNTSSSYTNNHKLTTYINGEVVWSYSGVTSYTAAGTLLSPGTYTIKWEDWIGESYDQYHSYIKNISLSSHWTEIELAYAGTLGVEVLYLFNVLTDVQFLKVKGNLNSTDWTTLKQMTNLRGLDLREASFTSIPANQFSNRTSLEYIVLPEGVQTIGDYAFQNTYLRQICIPSTVQSIGQYAFAKSKVPTYTMQVTFAENSQLQSIGKYCFKNSQLKRITLPNTVTSVGENCFEYNSMMDSMILSDAIQTLPSYFCNECSNLQYVHLPQNLNSIGRYCFSICGFHSIDFPQSLKNISYRAFNSCPLDSLYLPIDLSSMEDDVFYGCTSLKYIELPSSPNVGYNNTFRGSTAVQTIVCPSATPPSITKDPFLDSRDKSFITLKVPSFAVASYKLDSYWYQFGTIAECDASEEPNFLDIASELMLTNNRRPYGKPDIRIFTNGKLMVGGAAPMTIGNFEICCHPSSSSGAFVNSCPYVTADTAWAAWMMDNADKWYFMTPLYDVDLIHVAEHSDPQQFVFRYYNAANRAANGTGSSWQNVTNGVLYHGQGYIVQSSSSGWIRMPALNHSDTLLFNTEDISLPLTTHPSENVANENWNFIGNPYPCFFDIWYMDFTAPITVWTGSTYKAYSIADDSYALRPMEAFFVQKPDVVNNIIFHREGRQVTADVSHYNTEEAPVRKLPHTSYRKVYNLSITADNGLSDDARVVINDSASLSYEKTCDASKFMSMDANCPQLYTIDNDGNRLSINERPLNDGIVALGLYLPYIGEYTLSAVSTPNIILIDNQLGVSHDLHTASYTFSIDIEGENSARFTLLFGPNPIHTDLESIMADRSAQSCVIYTLDGKVAGYLSAYQDIHSLHLPIGIYMVRSGNEYTKIVVR